MTTRSKMPTQIIAGDSLALSLAGAASDYPASDGWAVSLVLTPNAGGTPVSTSATGGSDSWDITLTSSSSAALAAGTHRWAIAAAKSGERETIAFGSVEVLADPTALDTDQRSQARRALDAIDAVLENRAGSADLEFTFADGRSIRKVPHSELLQLRRHFAQRVQAEQRKSTGPKRVVVSL